MARRDDIDDDTLVHRSGAGDRHAAEQLVERHSENIFAVCFRMLGSRPAAEDAAQETFLRLWRNAHKWKSGRAKPGTWLYRVATNICIDQLRKQKREAPEEAAPEQVDPSLRPDQNYEAMQTRFHIEAALDMLPPRQKLAITLCHYQELTNIEAADVMETSIDALESLLSRGRRALREILNPLKSDLMEGQGNDHETVAH